MANGVYDYGREGFLGGDIDFNTNDVRPALVKAGYTPNLGTDQFLSTPAGNIGAPSASWRAASGVASPTITAGVASHAAKTLSAVLADSGNAATQLVYYAWSGADGTSRLICSIVTATGLPVTPNGGDISITPDAGANHLFKL